MIAYIFSLPCARFDVKKMVKEIKGPSAIASEFTRDFAKTIYRIAIISY